MSDSYLKLSPVPAYPFFFRGIICINPPIVLVLLLGCRSQIMPLIIQPVIVFMIGKNIAVCQSQYNSMHRNTLPADLGDSVKPIISSFQGSPLVLTQPFKIFIVNKGKLSS